MPTSSPVKAKQCYKRQEKKGTLILLNLNIFQYNKKTLILSLINLKLLYDIIVISVETDELVYYCSSTLLLRCNGLATVVCVNYH